MPEYNYSADLRASRIVWNGHSGIVMETGSGAQQRI